MREITAPKGYILDENEYSFSIRNNTEIVVVENQKDSGFVNKAQTGNVRIEKTSSDGNVKGFTFTVEGTDVTGNYFCKSYQTDENGLIYIDNIRLGDYVITEKSDYISSGYLMPDPLTVTVHNRKTVVAKFYNVLKSAPEVVTTGDTWNPTMWIVLTGFSLPGIIVPVYFLTRKKRSK